jgi:predicted RecA/RadA family phage recombinase
MNATFIQQGDRIDYTPAPGSDVQAGDVVVVNDLVGVAKSPITGGTEGSLAVTGVFEFPKVSDQFSDAFGFDYGEKVWWDLALLKATPFEPASYVDSVLLGPCVAAAARNATTVRVLLRPEVLPAS